MADARLQLGARVGYVLRLDPLVVLGPARRGEPDDPNIDLALRTAAALVILDDVARARREAAG